VGEFLCLIQNAKMEKLRVNKEYGGFDTREAGKFQQSKATIFAISSQ